MITIKSRLLSITAIVKRFQTEKHEVHPSDRLHFPLEFYNHTWCNKTIVMGLQGRQKSSMILYPFWYNTGV